MSCKFDHRAADDPIVFPGQPGAAHMHDFFGSNTTNAFSTADSMLAGGTSCHRPGDKSAYWVPTLMVNGQPVTPSKASIHYDAVGSNFQSVQPFPPGLRIIVGNAQAQFPQSLNSIRWLCAEDYSKLSASPPACHRPDLQIRLFFPNCWNGADLDSPDHGSHMGYTQRSGACPASHPVPVPKLSIIVSYPTTGGIGTTLSSGSEYSAHADFFNAWEPTELARLVTSCLNAGRKCEYQS